MPRGDKSKYTDKQKRQAAHIKDSYRERGVPDDEAAARAWATVNATSGGGRLRGCGSGKRPARKPLLKGARKAGAKSAARTFVERSAAAKKAARTRAAKKAAAAR